MSRTYKAGLVLLGVLSAIDLATPLISDGEHPPMAVAVAAAALGLASLALVWYAWRGARRALWPLIGLRSLSAVGAVPAFFAADVPAPAVAAAATVVVLTLVGVALVVPATRQLSVAGAR